MSLTIFYEVTQFGTENADEVSLCDPDNLFGFKVAGLDGQILVPAGTLLVNTTGLTWTYVVTNDQPMLMRMACVKITKNSVSTYEGFIFLPMQPQPGSLIPLPSIGCP